MTVSARGLFRATGKQVKPIAVETGVDLAGAFERPVFREREKDDFYPAPVEATRAFLAAEIGRLRDFPVLWEPAAGDGAMLCEMRALGLEVYASDLVDRGCGATIRSFYEFTRETAPARAIVTNPPFADCFWATGRARWLVHALDVLRVEYMALLLGWNWPGAAGLSAVWDRHPPARVYLMRWRLDFTGQGAPPQLHAFFVWDAEYRGEPLLKMLDRRDARQGDLFGRDR